MPSADVSMLRRKLVEHFKQHYDVLRAREDVHSTRACSGGDVTAIDACAVLSLFVVLEYGTGTYVML